MSFCNRLADKYIRAQNGQQISYISSDKYNNFVKNTLPENTITRQSQIDNVIQITDSTTYFSEFVLHQFELEDVVNQTRGVYYFIIYI
jgi:hypothetical protein